MVKRCGTKLSDILTTSDPWRGTDCLQEGCLLCKTKSLTCKLLAQDCKHRSIVYETYCMSCKDSRIREIEAKYSEEISENDEDEKEMRKKIEVEKIKIYKYIRET